MSRSTATPRPPRRYDAEATRCALLDAAGALFRERGYDAVTVREIGERAGVDAALIARYFGGKQGLYLAALEHDARPSLPADPAAALAAMLDRSETSGHGPIPHAMVSATLSDEMRAQIRTILERRAVQPLTEAFAAAGARDPQLRAELLVALAAGIALTRAGATLPRLSAASVDELVALLEPLTRPMSGYVA
jgi:AcrR family transcriptional regulator